MVKSLTKKFYLIYLNWISSSTIRPAHQCTPLIRQSFLNQDFTFKVFKFSFIFNEKMAVNEMCIERINPCSQNSPDIPAEGSSYQSKTSFSNSWVQSCLFKSVSN